MKPPSHFPSKEQNSCPPVAVYETPYWGHWGILNANLTVYGREVRASELESLWVHISPEREEERAGQSWPWRAVGEGNAWLGPVAKTAPSTVSSVSNDSLIAGLLSW